MFAAISKAAPFAAIAAAAILAGCTVTPAPAYDDVYAYTGPSTVFVDPCCYRYDYDHRFGHDGPGYHGGGMHGHR